MNTKTGFDSPSEAECEPCPFKERCLGGECADKFGGALCGACVKGYFPFGGGCEECPKIPWGVIAMIAVMVVGTALFARFDMTHWAFVAAIKQLVSFAQNVNICELVEVAYSAAGAASAAGSSAGAAAASSAGASGRGLPSML